MSEPLTTADMKRLEKLILDLEADKRRLDKLLVSGRLQFDCGKGQTWYLSDRESLDELLTWKDSPEGEKFMRGES